MSLERIVARTKIWAIDAIEMVEDKMTSPEAKHIQALKARIALLITSPGLLQSQEDNEPLILKLWKEQNPGQSQDELFRKYLGLADKRMEEILITYKSLKEGQEGGLSSKEKVTQWEELYLLVAGPAKGYVYLPLYQQWQLLNDPSAVLRVRIDGKREIVSSMPMSRRIPDEPIVLFDRRVGVLVTKDPYDYPPEKWGILPLVAKLKMMIEDEKENQRTQPVFGNTKRLQTERMI